MWNYSQGQQTTSISEPSESDMEELPSEDDEPPLENTETDEEAIAPTSEPSQQHDVHLSGIM